MYLFLLFLIADPVLQELGRRLVVQCRMHAFVVVEDLDVFKAFCSHLRPCGETPSVGAFVLETVEPALGGRVIPAAALATRWTGHAIRLERALKRLAGVLTAAIRVVDQTRCRATPKSGHGQRVGHNLRCHTGFE